MTDASDPPPPLPPLEPLAPPVPGSPQLTLEEGEGVGGQPGVAVEGGEEEGGSQKRRKVEEVGAGIVGSEGGGDRRDGEAGVDERGGGGEEEVEYRRSVCGGEALRIARGEPYVMRRPMTRGHLSVTAEYSMGQVGVEWFGSNEVEIWGTTWVVIWVVIS